MHGKRGEGVDRLYLYAISNNPSFRRAACVSSYALKWGASENRILAVELWVQTLSERLWTWSVWNRPLQLIYCQWELDTMGTQ